MNSLVEARGLVKRYARSEFALGRRSPLVAAVDDVSFEIVPNETLGLAGESGSGKSTLGRLLIKLEEPTSGSVKFEGAEVSAAQSGGLKAFRRSAQMIFQNTTSSLNPRKTVKDTLALPLRLHFDMPKKEISERVVKNLEEVGMNESDARKYPSELSGGQRQRVCIARAMSIRPKFIVADEPVSALDVSIRSQILKLMKKFQRENGVSYLMISHDLAVLRSMAQRIAVMYRGKFVETGTTGSVYGNPLHPYTQLILDSSPVPDPVRAREKMSRFQADEQAAALVGPGCRFNPRCPHAMDVCREKEPPLAEVEPNHQVACWLYPGEAGVPPQLHASHQVTA